MKPWQIFIIFVLYAYALDSANTTVTVHNKTTSSETETSFQVFLGVAQFFLEMFLVFVLHLIFEYPLETLFAFLFILALTIYFIWSARKQHKTPSQKLKSSQFNKVQQGFIVV
eukprot:TRINITY_DN5192_c0_g1_i1.p1 TRINITY_DN5192_c0_g1~~TRINITY_DN5192_c0_g1_i1.p1  ORF type:complete len:113 (-),score=5.09 TRINITY_DN5192_c0_g1_i1:42-380(-)